MNFPKYIHIAKISWQNGFVYRMNFVMWRIRNVIQLITIYFLWAFVSSDASGIGTYSHSQILTYVLGTSIIRSVVLSSRSIDAQGEIASGDLNNHLLKPFNYFGYWIARDFSDKLLNILFSVIEISLIIFILKPSIYFQTSQAYLVFFLVSLLLAACLYFIFSFIISMTTFWFYEHNGWGQRFLILTLIESLAGGLFPIDLFPDIIVDIISKLPTAYFIYFPMQIYLGKIAAHEIFINFGIIIFWIIILYLFAQYLWGKGLKVYGAFGR